MNDMSEIKLYKTNSLPLASYLYTKKSQIKFKGVDKKNPRKILFLFEPFEEGERLKDEFYASSDAMSLFQSYQVLKDIMFEEKRIVEFSE